MPLYEYECDGCRRRFELIRKFSDPPLASCPTCGGPVRKLFSSPAIQFKGTGWYVTDYARKPGAGEEASGKPAADSKEKPAPDKKSAPDAKPAPADASSSSSPSGSGTAASPGAADG